eukprot:GHVU01094660.1.p2 GENE.GHVU01094660.1~~GHVU01094660.1.p2  ORF type:complete len:131 (-),score=18.50 GHVU01094660.1:657-1049(-)
MKIGFPRSPYHEEVARWLARDEPHFTSRVALKAMQDTLERYDILIKRWKLEITYNDMEKRSWLYNKLPLAAHDAISKDYRDWSYSKLVEVIEKGILPREATMAATPSGWMISLTEGKPKEETGVLRAMTA